MNVGASKPEEYGDYFAWGETEPKSNFTWESYKYRDSGNSRDNIIFNKYNVSSSYGTVDNKTVLDSEDDAAHVNWGGRWRIPIEKEWIELNTNCTKTWVRNYNETDVVGMIVTSNIAGYTDKSIFFPAAGWWKGTNHNDARIKSRFLMLADPKASRYLNYITFKYDNEIPTIDNDDRYHGISVRPVISKQEDNSKTEPYE